MQYSNILALLEINAKNENNSTKMLRCSSVGIKALGVVGFYCIYELQVVQIGENRFVIIIP